MSDSSNNPIKRLQDLRVADAMSRKVACISGSDTMHRAAGVLANHSATGAPVIDDAGRCIGVLSATDFITFEMERSEELPAHGRVTNRPPRGGDVAWNSVQRFMATAVQTISDQAPLLQAAKMMCGEHIHRIVVLDDRSIPIGIVTTLDVVSALLSAINEQEAAAHEAEHGPLPWPAQRRSDAATAAREVP
jgi:CBS-domain-containing membrane protein